MKTKNKILILSISFLFFLSFASSASALELLYPPVIGADTPQVFLEAIDECRTTCQTGDPFECLKCEDDGYHAGGAFPLYMKYLYYFLIHICGLACFYAFVTGGSFLFLAGDSPTKAKEGLDRINLGVLGITLILASVLILNILNPGLLLFEMPRIKPPEAIVLTIPGVTEEFPAYVEIPIGGLIEILKQAASIVNRISFSIRRTSQSITDTSICLNRLTNECECGRPVAMVDTCCGEWEATIPGSEEPEEQRCVEEVVPEGEACPTGNCRPFSDPCDVPTPNLLVCDDLGQSVGPNLRTSIESKLLYLGSLVTQIGIQREILIRAEEYLNTANRRLKMAEALMRNSISPAINFETFAGLNNKEIIRIFPREIIRESGSGASDQLEYGRPGPECQGHSPQEDMPRCILCLNPELGDELVCLGNNYRCCDTSGYITAMCNGNDDCTNPPAHINQEYCDITTFAGCSSPRNCGGEWKSGEDLKTGVGGDSFSFNGITYPIPAGGAYFIGSTVMQGCAAYR